MFIKIKNYSGKFNCNVVAFSKYNFEKLHEIVKNVFKNYNSEKLPSHYNDIKTLKDLKSFIKKYELDELDYPVGFKYIEGVYCFYEAY